jgi:hypothetical protein
VKALNALHQKNWVAALTGAEEARRMARRACWSGWGATWKAEPCVVLVINA